MHANYNMQAGHCKYNDDDALALLYVCWSAAGVWWSGPSLISYEWHWSFLEHAWQHHWAWQVWSLQRQRPVLEKVTWRHSVAVWLVCFLTGTSKVAGTAGTAVAFAEEVDFQLL